MAEGTMHFNQGLRHLGIDLSCQDDAPFFNPLPQHPSNTITVSSLCPQASPRFPQVDILQEEEHPEEVEQQRELGSEEGPHLIPDDVKQQLLDMVYDGSRVTLVDLLKFWSPHSIS